MSKKRTVSSSTIYATHKAITKTNITISDKETWQFVKQFELKSVRFLCRDVHILECRIEPSFQRDSKHTPRLLHLPYWHSLDLHVDCKARDNIFLLNVSEISTHRTAVHRRRQYSSTNYTVHNVRLLFRLPSWFQIWHRVHEETHISRVNTEIGEKQTSGALAGAWSNPSCDRLITCSFPPPASCPPQWKFLFNWWDPTLLLIFVIDYLGCDYATKEQ